MIYCTAGWYDSHAGMEGNFIINSSSLEVRQPAVTLTNLLSANFASLGGSPCFLTHFDKNQQKWNRMKTEANS